MKASEIIEVLSRSIEKYGDKRVLFYLGKGDIWFDPVISEADLHKWKVKHSADSPCLYFDLKLE